MPKSRKSSKKNGKQANTPDNQWVHVEDTPQPDPWEIVEDVGLQEGARPLKDEGPQNEEGPLKESGAVSLEDDGKLSDDDLIVILEDSCQQSLDLSLVTGEIPQESSKDSPKQESPSTEESPIISHEESPESELDKSSDFQIIDHSEDESSNDTDLLLENEILEAAKRNVTLKYSHIVRQSSAPSAEPSVQATPAGNTCTKTPVTPVPSVGESLVPETSPAVGRQSSKEAVLTTKKQISEQGAKPKTEKDNPVAIVPEKAEDSPSSGKDIVVEATKARETAASSQEINVQETTGFVETKSKKQKRKEKKRQAAIEATEDVMDETADPDSKESEDQESTQGSEPDTSSAQKTYFETFSKNKKQRDLATMSILLAKDQTIEDLQDEAVDNTKDLRDEEAVADTKDLKDVEAVADTKDLLGGETMAGTKEPKRSLELVRESSVPEETESVSGCSEETASVAGTEEYSDRPDADGSRDIDEQNVPKKVSKSARRRKKMKEKMAKVIENFSNPGLVMEKYEKTFGEDYVPASKDIDTAVDSSMTCPVCLELYYHPHQVEPCDHVFCEPCLRKLTTRTCLDIPCPLCRNIIQSCHLNEELSHHITKSFPVKTAARNRAERKRKNKKNLLPRMDMEAGKPVSMKDIHPRGGNGQEVRFSRTTIQRVLLVLIGLISYIFTSYTIRAITYFDLNANNSTNYIFMTLIFCLYFYFVDKGVQKLKYLVES